MGSVPFLKEVALWLLKQEKFSLQSVCVVFPNKRARLYLSKYIGELTQKPVWAPQYVTISDLLEKISGYTIADKLTLVFELYKAYGKVTGSAEHFDTFYPYSETLLSDFDETDKYLANADDLFANLADLKLLDGKFNYLTDEQTALIQKFWNTFNPGGLSHDQHVFISLWESLAPVYHEFRNGLESKGLAYEGMAYRKAMQLIANNDSALFPMEQYVFVGFNALNKCEEMLFYHLKNTGKAVFFWDYDDWYVNNGIHEAGFFMRNNLKNFPPEEPLKTTNLDEKKLHRTFFVPVYSNTGQATVLPLVFEKMGISEPANIERTAVVLADENLLMPVLYSIPSTVSEINVTMGYPVSGSSVFSLVDSLYELSRNARHDNGNPISWYFNDVIAIMGNPLTQFLYADKAEIIRNEILTGRISYMSTSQIDLNHDDLIFNPAIYNDTCKYLLEIIAFVIRNTGHTIHDKFADPVLTELLFQVYTSLTRLQDILTATALNPGFEVLFRIIRKMLGMLHIPFTGEPLAGLQVLGILETRTLDFDNVILLSANEGVLPKSSDKPSFIPYNLRAGFGLPTPEYHDAIYAYYFYRLIQRAGNVGLLYDATSGGLKTGERSRYLHQLEYEMRLPVIPLNTEFVLAAIPVKPVIIEKSEAVQQALLKYTGREAKLLSPSAVNEYLNCPVRFYFHHIAGVPQPENTGEEVDARMFGNILHRALGKIYEDFGNTAVTGERISQLLKDEKRLETQVYEAFCHEMYGETSHHVRQPEGYNVIIFKVIHGYIRQFLKSEMESAPFTIQSLEKIHAINLNLKVNEKEIEINAGGYIDRIDLYEGKIRILDYKTGSVKDRFDGVDSLFEGAENRNDAVFQVFFYSYVYKKLNPDAVIQPGLFFLRQSHADGFTPVIRMGSKKDNIDNINPYLGAFEEKLIAALHKIFDFKIPFVQTANDKLCSSCPYALICRRGAE